MKQVQKKVDYFSVKAITILIIVFVSCLSISSCGNGNGGSNNLYDSTQASQDSSNNANIDKKGNNATVNDTLNKSNPVVDTNMVK